MWNSLVVLVCGYLSAMKENQHCGTVKSRVESSTSHSRSGAGSPAAVSCHAVQRQGLLGESFPVELVAVVMQRQITRLNII